MGGLSLWHWLIVLVIVLLVFGTKRLKNVGQDLGEAIKGFKKGMHDEGAKPGADDVPPAQLPDASRRDDVRGADVRSEQADAARHSNDRDPPVAR